MIQLDKWTRQIQFTDGLREFLEQDSILLSEENLNLIEIEVKKAIRDALEAYGSVFVKLNGKAPTDSYFLVNDLRCFTLEDVLVLLKGSSRLQLNKQENCLLLKKWITIDPKEEFRCFIKDKELKGICQRHLDLFMDYQSEELNKIKDKVIKKINELNPKLSQGCVIMDFAYLQGRVKVLDIEQIPDTDNENNKEILLLFTSWSYLADLDHVEFKYIEEENQTRQGEENLNRFPLELLESDMETLFKIINQS